MKDTSMSPLKPRPQAEAETAQPSLQVQPNDNESNHFYGKSNASQGSFILRPLLQKDLASYSIPWDVEVSVMLAWLEEPHSEENPHEMKMDDHR